MPRKFGFALFGSGRMGSIHFKNLLLNEKATVRYIAEEVVDKAYELLDRYDMRQVVQVVGLKDVDTIFRDKSVDAVVIATPPSTHEKLVKDVLKAGKGVFCEKPLAPTIEATKSCYAAAREATLPLFCAFNRRFEPQLRLMHDRIRAGEIGRVRSLRSTSRDTPQMMNPAYLALSGGIFLDSCVHDIDMLNWLVGEDPVTVYAEGHAAHQTYKDCDDVDTCLIVLKYPGGAIGTVEVCRQAPVGHDTRVEVLGSEGLLRSENRRTMNLQHQTTDGTSCSPIYQEGIHRYWQSYEAELAHFIDVLEGSVSVDVTAESTVMVNVIAAACRESLRSGAVINLREYSQKHA